MSKKKFELLIPKSVAASLLGVCAQTVLQMARAGHLRPRLVRGVRMFDVADVERLRRRREANPRRRGRKPALAELVRETER